MTLDDEDDKTVTEEAEPDDKETGQEANDGASGADEKEAAKADAGDGEEPKTEGKEDSDTEEAKTRAKAEAEGKAKGKTPRWVQKRFAEMTATIHEERRRREELEAKLKGSGSPGGDEAEESQRSPEAGAPDVIQELADRLADQKLAQKQFDDDCNRTFDAGAEKFGKEEFQESLGTLKAMGAMQPAVVSEVLATDAPHEVLHKLAQDPEEAMRILALPGPKRIAEFVKMALPEGKAARPVSKAPTPIKPISGSPGKDFDFNDPDADDAEWHRRMDDHERKQAQAMR